MFSVPVETVEPVIVGGNPYPVLRVDDHAHNLLAAVERRTAVCSGFQVEQEQPLPAAATEYSFFIPKAEYRDIEVSEIRCLDRIPAAGGKNRPGSCKSKFCFWLRIITPSGVGQVEYAVMFFPFSSVGR